MDQRVQTMSDGGRRESEGEKDKYTTRDSKVWADSVHKISLRSLYVIIVTLRNLQHFQSCYVGKCILFQSSQCGIATDFSEKRKNHFS